MRSQTAKAGCAPPRATARGEGRARRAAVRHSAREARALRSRKRGGAVRIPEAAREPRPAEGERLATARHPRRPAPDRRARRPARRRRRALARLRDRCGEGAVVSADARRAASLHSRLPPRAARRADAAGGRDPRARLAGDLPRLPRRGAGGGGDVRRRRGRCARRGRGACGLAGFAGTAGDWLPRAADALGRGRALGRRGRATRLPTPTGTHATRPARRRSRA